MKQSFIHTILKNFFNIIWKIFIRIKLWLTDKNRHIWIIRIYQIYLIFTIYAFKYIFLLIPIIMRHIIFIFILNIFKTIPSITYFHMNYLFCYLLRRKKLYSILYSRPWDFPHTAGALSLSKRIHMDPYGSFSIHMDFEDFF